MGLVESKLAKESCLSMRSVINVMKPAAANSWHILSEAPAFAAPPYLSISRHHVRTDSGVEVPDYWQVKLPDFAIAVALTESEEVITLWQYKHGARRFGLTFPAGHIEAGETPEAAMRRELIEETGYEAGGARALGNFTLSANQGCGMAHLFLMSRCRSVRDAASGDLERMELRLMSVRNVEEMLRAGAAVALPHVAAWGAARLVWDGSGDHDRHIQR
jgi:ADP-ribose pyrophosphatase